MVTQADLSFPSFATACLLLIVCNLCVVHNLQISSNDKKSALRSVRNLNPSTEQLDEGESVATLSFNFSVICESPLYVNYISDNQKLGMVPLTPQEVEDFYFETTLSLVHYFSITGKTITAKSYTPIEDVIRKENFISPSREFIDPNEEMYDMVWQSILARDSGNSKATVTAKNAAIFISELYNVINPPDQRILENYFSQPLKFDMTNKRSESLDPDFSSVIDEIPETIRSAMPQNVSLIQIIEEIQNMVAWDGSQEKFNPRIFTVQLLDLNRCRNSNHSKALMVRVNYYIIPTTTIPSITTTPTTIPTTTKTTIKLSTTKNQSIKGCGDLLTTNEMTFHTQSLPKDWIEAIDRYKVERQSCISGPSSFTDSKSSVETCLCSINLKFKNWICVEELMKAERNVIAIAHVILDELKNAFRFHKKIRQFCNDLSKVT